MIWKISVALTLDGMLLRQTARVLLDRKELWWQFYPGSIHSGDVMDSGKLNCRPMNGINVLTKGYVIPFVEFPPASKEAHNKSAI